MAIQKFQPLDIFGRGRQEIKNKETALWPYQFSIAIENASYPDYFTEKITDCFAAKTIPIYWGNPDIANYFESRGILWLQKTERSMLSSGLYKKMFPFVQKNYEIVKNMTLPDDLIFKKILYHICLNQRIAKKDDE